MNTKTQRHEVSGSGEEAAHPGSPSRRAFGVFFPPAASCLRVFVLKCWNVALLTTLMGIAGAATAAPNRTDYKIRFWEARLMTDPYDNVTTTELGTAYAQKARECGDSVYCVRAEKALRKSLERAPDNYLALATLAWVQVGEHRFQEARKLAAQCLKRQPDDPFNYANLGDAEVELGEYTAAAATIGRMVALAPGLASSARMAYQRELHGDRQEALRWMQRAAAAASPADEQSSAWCWTQLGDLSFKSGRLAEARRQYDTALKYLPDYYLALFGKARVAAAERKFAEAEQLLDYAIAVIPRPDFVAALGDVYALAGKKEEARKQYELVVQIEAVNRAAGAPDNRRLALFYANHDRDLATALSLARREYSVRQDIFTCDALAWALYKNRRFDEAWQAAKQAMRLKTEDAGILYHAGLIARHVPGQSAAAKRLLKQTLAINPYFDPWQPPPMHATLAARSGS